jgi:hypothetical protein
VDVGSDPVEVVCPEHGAFFVSKTNLLHNKCGCPKCSSNYSYTEAEFLKKVKDVYGDEYDLEKIKYSGLSKELTIFCDDHGYVRVHKAFKFLRGAGCPRCYQTKGSPL